MVQVSLWKIVDDEAGEGIGAIKQAVVNYTHQNISLTLEPYKFGRKDEKPGKYVAIDCEFVGVGPDGSISAPARVSIVNYNGHVILDKHISPNKRITDFRTRVSGITPKDLRGAMKEDEAAELVASVLRNKVVIGHAVHHDFDALDISMNDYDVCDTQFMPTYQKLLKSKRPGLKNLCKEVFNLEIQNGSHDSVEDARMTMLLYKVLAGS